MVYILLFLYNFIQAILHTFHIPWDIIIMS